MNGELLNKPEKQTIKEMESRATRPYGYLKIGDYFIENKKPLDYAIDFYKKAIKTADEEFLFFDFPIVAIHIRLEVCRKLYHKEFSEKEIKNWLREATELAQEAQDCILIADYLIRYFGEIEWGKSIFEKSLKLCKNKREYESLADKIIRILKDHSWAEALLSNLKRLVKDERIIWIISLRENITFSRKKEIREAFKNPVVQEINIRKIIGIFKKHYKNIREMKMISDFTNIIEKNLSDENYMSYYAKNILETTGDIDKAKCWYKKSLEGIFSISSLSLPEDRESLQKMLKWLFDYLKPRANDFCSLVNLVEGFLNENDKKLGKLLLKKAERKARNSFHYEALGEVAYSILKDERLSKDYFRKALDNYNIEFFLETKIPQRVVKFFGDMKWAKTILKDVEEKFKSEEFSSELFKKLLFDLFLVSRDEEQIRKMFKYVEEDLAGVIKKDWEWDVIKLSVRIINNYLKDSDWADRIIQKIYSIFEEETPIFLSDKMGFINLVYKKLRKEELGIEGYKRVLNNLTGYGIVVAYNIMLRNLSDMSIIRFLFRESEIEIPTLDEKARSLSRGVASSQKELIYMSKEFEKLHGVIEGEFRVSDFYQVDKDLIIAPDGLFLIAPYIKLIFSEGVGIYCFGRLICEKSHKFLRHAIFTGKDWSGLWFIGRKAKGSYLKSTLLSGVKGEKFKDTVKKLKNFNWEFPEDKIIEMGGALNLINIEKITLDSCEFYKNYSSEGGAAINAINSAMNIENSIFEKNKAKSNKGIINLNNSRVNMKNSYFRRNCSPGEDINCGESQLKCMNNSFL